MTLKTLALEGFFGGKPWFKSYTGWGVFVLIVAEAAILALGELALVDADLLNTINDYFLKISGILAVLGIRRKLPASGTIGAAMLAMVLVLPGCTKMSVTTLDANGSPITVEAKAGGRSCLAATIDPKTGGVDVVAGQDGTSDWASIRSFPLMVQAALTAVLGARPGETSGFEGPSAIGGCDTIFQEGE